MLLQEIKGLGQKRIEKLTAAGITTPVDLVTLFPYKYVDTTTPLQREMLKEGDEVAFKGKLTEKPSFKFVRKGLNFVRANFLHSDLTIHAIWFNQRFIMTSLHEGQAYTVLGKIKRLCKNGVIEVTASKLISKDSAYGIIPLYRLPLPENVFLSAIPTVLSKVKLSLGLTPQIMQRFDLMDLNQAVMTLHFPQSMQQVRAAEQTLALGNLGNLIARFRLIKETSGKNKPFSYIADTKKCKEVINSLPFELTDDQQNALGEIFADMKSPSPMNRLLQGDVGSGKTIIALICMYYAAISGFQSVFMAPTEILARQHYIKAQQLFTPLGLKMEFLSAGLSAEARQTALFNIRHNADMIFGTHALYGEDVEFCRPSLIVTDEQQRFGVMQRGKLDNKSNLADSLILSATPIPRTLALTLYGELKQSCLKSVWKEKAKIITKIVPEHKTEDMIEYLIQKAQQGEQSYIVCPRISSDGESELKSVEEVYEKLSAHKLIRGSVAMLTGEMKEKEKNAVMSEFHSGNVKILVSTTVIEVGIDNPNATSIVIFDADRFGLSQLHQLRGRVGRGKLDSYCFLLSGCKASEERLRFLTQNDDGFKIADYDFETRGAGDFIGSKQHGESTFMPDFKITAPVLQQANAIAECMLSDARVKAELLENMTQNGAQFMKSIVLN